ncbi:MAG: tagaturonate reductase [Planctomycetaceae bacterium]
MKETILQLGAGRFLRAFVDRFVQQANDSGQNVGKVVVVQSTPGRRAELLQNPDGYRVLVRGYENQELVDRVETVQCISRALVAQDAWAEILEVVRSPALKFIVTNATEAGYELQDDDRENTQTSSAPVSMPAKLTQLLWERFQSGGEPLVILPCELIERNADKLREIVIDCATCWNLPENFQEWIRNDCGWLNNLVDCIVTTPTAETSSVPATPADVQAEPYALWAIERTAVLPKLFHHPAIQLVDDLAPYYIRKVRILNGLHTAMVAKFLPAGMQLVRDVFDDPKAIRWLQGLLWEEIVPTIVHRVPNLAEFAFATWDRLRNPFVSHRLEDIALHHASKLKVRLQPSYDDYKTLFGQEPVRLCEILANPSR